MKKAAELAGLLDERQAGPTMLMFISEPEAAALATLSEMKDRPDISPGETMIVCDVGGGTADLIAYVIDSMSPFKIDECVAGQGGLCGGIFVDQNFENLIATKVGQKEWDNLDVFEKRRFINQDWENGIKTQFENQDRDWPVSLPPGCQPPVSLGKRKRALTLELTSDELLGVFSPVIDEISNLVRGQVEAIKDKNLQAPKFIILVGGFGSSRLLYNTLSADHPDSTILQGQGESPVCRGAAIHGATCGQVHLQPLIAVKSRLARYSYGLLYNDHWNKKKHNHQDRLWDEITESWKAKYQTCWFLTNGYSWREKSQADLITGELHYSAKDTPPTRLDDSVKRLCEVKWSPQTALNWKLRHSVVTNTPYYELSYEIRVKVDGPTITFEVVHDGTTAATGTVQIEFE
ncbi:hypothetical protein NQ176_g6757 [Zarea fungicola]|uniref:Uncharacterized protein n=1 Tax=Zarea fungicola TaxID=93591 RepID=A0ACC1N319_9HYPO|nr:hypothetical protein NQ176_g6757 [Lecanicillium fungicola]